MFHEIEKVTTQESIIALNIYDDVIVLFDKNYTLYQYGLDAKLISKIKILPDQEPLHTYCKSVSFFRNQKEFISLFGIKPMGLHLSFAEPKPTLLHKIPEPRKTVEAAATSLEGNYFALGDASGRTFVFETQTAHLVTSLTPRPDYVATLAFSPDERFVVSCSYDKTVTIMDLVLNIEVGMFRTSDVVESLSFYNDCQSIALVQRNGAFAIYHVDERRLEAEINLFPAWPTSTVVTADQRHIFVGLKNGSLSVVNLETQEVRFNESIANKGISQLLLEEDTLVVTTEDKQTIFIDKTYLIEPFEDALKIKEYSKVKDMIGKNIFLILNKDYDEEMIELYEPLFKQVHELMEKGLVDEAKALTEPFTNDPKIMHNFNLLLQSESQIKKLAQLVKARQIPQAYQLIEKYHILQDTPAAISLERHWQQTFNKAKILCKEKTVTGLKEAQKLLEPFLRVEQKQKEIHAVLKNIQVYIQADELVSKRAFKAYFELVKKAPFLEDNEVHKNIIQMSKKILARLRQTLSTNDLSKAKELLVFLEPFTNIRKEYEEAKTGLNMRVKFFDAVQKQDINTIFGMAKTYPELRYFKEYKSIESQFKVLSKKALDLAFKADTKAILELFKPYLEITLFEDKIASLAKISYLNEIRQVPENSAINWSVVFTKLVALYGKSDDIVHMAQQRGQIELLKSMQEAGDKQGYKKQPLPLSILA